MSKACYLLPLLLSMCQAVYSCAQSYKSFEGYNFTHQHVKDSTYWKHWVFVSVKKFKAILIINYLQVSLINQIDKCIIVLVWYIYKCD